MRKALVRGAFMALSLAALSFGCCQNPQAAAQVRQTLHLVQGTYYTATGFLKPEIKAMEQADNYVALGITLADQALALAGALQEQYCPDPAEVAAAQAKADEAEKLAAQAGVK